MSNTSQCTDDSDESNSETERNFRVSGRSASSLLGRDDKLQKNYKVHDVAEERAVELIWEAGLIPVPWGIDARGASSDNIVFEESASDFLIYHAKDEATEEDVDKLFERGERLQELRSDLAVARSNKNEEKREELARKVDEFEELFNDIASRKFELVSVYEVKAKNKNYDGWYGVINDRHYSKYREIKRDQGVPFWIYMSLVDMDKKEVVKEQMIPLRDEEGQVLRRGDIRCKSVGSDGYAPDGNRVVQFKKSDYFSYQFFLADIGIESESLTDDNMNLNAIDDVWIGEGE
jgi:hypothetical protein